MVSGHHPTGAIKLPQTVAIFFDMPIQYLFFDDLVIYRPAAWSESNPEPIASGNLLRYFPAVLSSSERGIILLLQLGQAATTIFSTLLVMAALSGQKLLLGVAQVLHDDIAGAGHHRRITPRRRLLSSRKYRSQAISRAAAGDERGPSRLSMNWIRSRTAQRSGVMSPGSLARCRQEMRRRIRR